MIRPLASWVVAILVVQAAPAKPYQDPDRRFTFSYPAAFGATSSGTNNGFADRVSAVRFSSFPARFGGEAVLTRGFPLIDLQAVGGLYDSLTLEIFPDPLRQLVVGQLPRLTVENFCRGLAQTTHLDLKLPAFASLTPQQRAVVGRTDMLRNANSRVIECKVTGDTVSFDKEREFAPGYPLQHVYGAVRFLSGPFSTFQLIAGGEEPPQSTRAAIDDLVASFRLQ